NIERIGVRGLLKANEAADEIDGDIAIRFINGYGSLMQALQAEAESYGAQFHLSTIVNEIRWQSDRVDVSAEMNSGSQRLSASAVLVTLPLAILQAKADDGGVRFVPELPRSKQTAIKKLVTGNVIKINFNFREPFWEHAKVWDEDGSSIDFRDAGFFHCPGVP